MHLSTISVVLLANSWNVAAMRSPDKHQKTSHSWAGVNSFFLHAFPQYVQSLVNSINVEFGNPD
jgi:hypothetical protein